MEHNSIVNNIDVFQTSSEVDCESFPYIIGTSKNFSFRPFVPIEVHLIALEEWPKFSIVEPSLGEIQENVDIVDETWKTDPLLALAGTLECDVTGIKIRLKNTVRPKTNLVKGPYDDHPDPLLALAGTLECDVTDIGERHDDYIGDALLAELWGDEDE